jgi:hypothetical protein
MLNINCIDTMLDLVLVEIFHCMFRVYWICDKPRAQFSALWCAVQVPLFNSACLSVLILCWFFRK